jgi:hypothetical protein
MHKYYPVLLSKGGELKALQHLEQRVKASVAPVLQILELKPTINKFLRTHWSFDSNRVLLDFSLLSDMDTLAVQNNVRAFILDVVGAGVNAIPCVQINSPDGYVNLVRNLIQSNGSQVCIKTSNASGGFDNYGQQINGFAGRLGSNPMNTMLLLDLGYVLEWNCNLMANVATMSLRTLNSVSDWMGIIVASGSFPQNLSDLTARPSAHEQPMHEWSLWRRILDTDIADNVRYGDFGTKHPIYQDVEGFAGTISVKYTVPSKFVIYRGHLSKSHPHGHGQYITHALSLATTPGWYSGADFSWGDDKIYEKSRQDISNPKRTPGSAATWVQYSQNHHITLMHSLL